MPDQVALETEARISPLINEKKRLFNDLLTAKGTYLSSRALVCSLSLSLAPFTLAFIFIMDYYSSLSLNNS